MAILPLIGVTQRVVNLPGSKEHRDVLDQAWTGFLHACGYEILPIPNCHPCPEDFVKNIGIKGLLLTGGNNISNSFKTINGDKVVGLLQMQDLAPERDKTENALLTAGMLNSWLVLGVCRGMQILNAFHGGKLRPIPGHASTKHKLSLPNREDKYLIDTVNNKVNSFHDMGITEDDLASGMHIMAKAGESIEAIINYKFNHLGIMWHPEREKPFRDSDIKLVRAFFNGDNKN